MLFNIQKASASEDTNSVDSIEYKEYDDYDRCLQTEPTKDIIEECTESNKLKDKVCCYMTVKYEYNSFYTCYPVEKDKKIIERKINEIKGDYDGCKSIRIDCKSSFIKYNLIILLLILI